MSIKFYRTYCILFVFLSFFTRTQAQSTILFENFDVRGITGFQSTACYGNGTWTNSAYILSGPRHGWFNIRNGMSNVVFYRRSFTALTQTSNIDIEYHLLGNSPNAPIELVVEDGNGRVVFSQRITPTVGRYQVMRHSIPSTSSMNYTFSFRALFRGGSQFDIAMEDFHISQVVTLNQQKIALAAQVEASTAQVNWSLPKTDQVQGFILEHSQDGINFEGIDEQVYELNQASYTYQDADLKDGSHYYRVQALHRNGTVTYSSIVEVSIKGTNQHFEVYPNPCSDYIVLSGISEDEAIVSLYNQQGQLCMQRQFKEPNTQQELSIDKSLPSGVYTLRIMQGQTTRQKRIIVQ